MLKSASEKWRRFITGSRNLSDQETRGLASFNVSPGQAGPFFNKLACFCFQEQSLGPHEKAEWPVVFFLDPKLQDEPMMEGVEEVTLSYTFFASKGKTVQGGEAAQQSKKVGLNSAKAPLAR